MVSGMEPQPLPTELIVPHRSSTLICRLPILDDIPAVVDACQDPEIPRWTTVPAPYGPAEAREFVEATAVGWGTRRALETIITPGEGHPLADLGLLGAVGARLDWDGEQATVGYWMHVDARGHRVASTAVGGFCRWLLDLGLQRIEAEVLVGNVASCRTLESVGFKLEGTRRSLAAGHCGDGSGRLDQHTFGLVPSDFVDPGGA